MGIEIIEKEIKRLQFEKQKLKEALKPLINIANAFWLNGLDEARPDWGHTENSDIELLTGRGGKCLLTLKDVFNAQKISELVQ